jgi:hypothetical protein
MRVRTGYYVMTPGDCGSMRGPPETVTVFGKK